MTYPDKTNYPAPEAPRAVPVDREKELACVASILANQADYLECQLGSLVEQLTPLCAAVPQDPAKDPKTSPFGSKYADHIMHSANRIREAADRISVLRQEVQI